MSYVSPGRASAPQGALWLVLAAGLMGAAGVALAAVAAHRLESPALATAAMAMGFAVATHLHRERNADMTDMAADLRG